jgi:hypothetical protein
VVSHRSTDNAITSLTSEIGRDPVLFGVYGRSYYFDNFDGLYSCVLSKDDEVLRRLSWQLMVVIVADSKNGSKKQ